MSIYGMWIALCVILMLLGHELWRINQTLKRIADILSEDREEKEV